MEDIEKITKKIYETYCFCVGGKSFNGEKLPSWEEFSKDQSKEIQANAWRAVAQVFASDNFSINPKVVDLEKIKSNSLILVRASDWMIENYQDDVKRAVYDFKSKTNLDDSCVIWVMSDSVEISTFDEDEMKELGWVRAGKV